MMIWISTALWPIFPRQLPEMCRLPEKDTSRSFGFLAIPLESGLLVFPGSLMDFAGQGGSGFRPWPYTPVSVIIRHAVGRIGAGVAVPLPWVEAYWLIGQCSKVLLYFLEVIWTTSESQRTWRGLCVMADLGHWCIVQLGTKRGAPRRFWGIMSTATCFFREWVMLEMSFLL